MIRDLTGLAGCSPGFFFFLTIFSAFRSKCALTGTEISYSCSSQSSASRPIFNIWQVVIRIGILISTNKNSGLAIFFSFVVVVVLYLMLKWPST